MTDWQPIETAPRDGAPILSWDGTQCAVVAWGGLLLPEWVLLEGDNKPYPDCATEWSCTHWMPLPEPPNDRTNPRPSWSQIVKLEDRAHMTRVLPECSGKEKFATYELAARVAGRRRRSNGNAKKSGVHPYRCVACSYFHIGSKKP